MQDFFILFIDFLTDILSVLDSVELRIFNLPTTLLSLMVAFLVVGFVVSIFWRGAKT